MPLGLLYCALCNDIYAVLGLSLQILEYVHLYSINIKYLETQQNICLNTLLYRMYAFKNFFIAQLYPYTIF